MAEKTQSTSNTSRRLEFIELGAVTAVYSVLDKDGNQIQGPEGRIEERIDAMRVTPSDTKTFGKQLVSDPGLLEETKHQMARLKALPVVDTTPAVSAAQELNDFINAQ